MVDVGWGGVGHVNVKKYVPYSLATREGLGQRDAKRVDQYVRTFQFRPLSTVHFGAVRIGHY